MTFNIYHDVTFERFKTDEKSKWYLRPIHGHQPDSIHSDQIVHMYVLLNMYRKLAKVVCFFMNISLISISDLIFVNCVLQISLYDDVFFAMNMLEYCQNIVMCLKNRYVSNSK